MCISNVKGRSNRKGHRGFRPKVVLYCEGLEAMLKRRDAGQAAGEVGGELKVDALARKYPSLWEWLTSAKYDDGSARVLPTVNVFIDAGCVKAFANDRDQGLSACVSAASLEGLLAALDQGLKDDTLEWRVSGAGKKRKK